MIAFGDQRFYCEKSYPFLLIMGKSVFIFQLGVNVSTRSEHNFG